MQSLETSTSCVLPFEIVEMIIDLLAEQNNINSLKATSLVCQSVLPRCRKYLFSSIEINKDSKSTEMCLTLLSPKTDIPKYIRKLEYHLRGNTLSTIHPALLARISCLQSLIFRYSEDLGAYDWTEIDPSVRSALINLMHLPTLTDLRLIHINHFPASHLFSCTGLKHLQLDYVDIADESPCTLLPSKLDIVTVPRIQEYTVKGSASTTMALSTAKLVDGRVALDFTNLKRLSVDLEANEDVEATRHLLKEFKQVEELRVDVAEYDPGGLTGLADMAFHTFGTTLCLQLLNAWDFKTPHGVFFKLCNELSAMTTKNNTLKNLRIEINADSSLEIAASSEWERLDAVLSSPGWSFLEHISLDIITWDYRGLTEELKLLIDLPSTRLTRLSSKKSLDFKFSVL